MTKSEGLRLLGCYVVSTSQRVPVDTALHGVRPHIPEDLNIQQYNCNNLKYRNANSIQQHVVRVLLACMLVCVCVFLSI
jgi:hypothetical protein